eukprot:CAMPEP_0194189984 /NCGR_PEP_ID=MMETSP0154-20130528/61269_1 /TAXON_ID=1049557 /ORGANISM="Thalassiothrix antarctica, Strain L6-D1" /LENGTH=185 /DNA_ID=CAMNT_0038911585 /DNA_START=62 /DNA_END=616 /DNA_ORIENTATION=+
MKERYKEKVTKSMRYESMSTIELRQLLAQYGMNDDDIETNKKEDMIETVRKLEKEYFDNAGKELFRKLNLDSALRTKWNDLDAIWQHPKGSTVYVGNYVAASDRKVLQDHNIYAVVNCQGPTSTNYFEHDDEKEAQKKITYHRFDISKLAVRLLVNFPARKKKDDDNNKNNATIMMTGAFDGILP